MFFFLVLEWISSKIALEWNVAPKCSVLYSAPGALMSPASCPWARWLAAARCYLVLSVVALCRLLMIICFKYYSHLPFLIGSTDVKCIQIQCVCVFVRLQYTFSSSVPFYPFAFLSSSFSRAVTRVLLHTNAWSVISSKHIISLSLLFSTRYYTEIMWIVPSWRNYKFTCRFQTRLETFSYGFLIE